MRTIAIINQKGGCGKTTVSINLAATLAAKGHRTLLVDMDPQSHCALGLAVPDAQICRSIADVLHAGLDGSIGVADITWQISRNFDLAPSAMALAGTEQRLATASDKDRRLAQVLSPMAERYDFCVVDCPPSIGLLTFNALRAADEVLIPVETGYFSLQGSVKQERTIEMLAQRVGHRVRFKVLPTMYDVRTRLAREILGELKKHFGDQMTPMVINFNSKLKEAASFGQPITEYDAGSRGMADFEELAGWLIANPPEQPAIEAGAGEAGQAIEATTSRRSPALSRAAELVERARALSARTAALSARMHDEMRDVDVSPAPRLVPPQMVVQEAPTMSPRVTSVPAGLREQVSRLYGVRKTSAGLLFVQPEDRGGAVAIAGDFNNWQPEAMSRDDRLGVWQTCVPIRPGRYHYKLVVDGKWVTDPYNEQTEMTGSGQVHNVIELAE